MTHVRIEAWGEKGQKIKGHEWLTNGQLADRHWSKYKDIVFLSRLPFPGNISYWVDTSTKCCKWTKQIQVSGVIVWKEFGYNLVILSQQAGNRREKRENNRTWHTEYSTVVWVLRLRLCMYSDNRDHSHPGFVRSPNFLSCLRSNDLKVSRF